MKLAVISHTPHYKKSGEIVGWEPTIRELDHLTKIFDEIFHVAPLHLTEPPGSSSGYKSEKIKFIPLKPYGGEKLTDKISVLTTAFHNLGIIRDIMNKVDWIQFRAPTAMGVYVLPYISFKSEPKRWVKYAGNWKMENAPMSYKFQKWWLNNNFQNSKVTINGYWNGQKKHILNFENPCLDNDELEKAGRAALDKNFDGKLILCFAGALIKSKGVDIIFEALSGIKNKNQIKEIILAGDGSEKKRYEKLASGLDFPVTFAGFLNRQELEKVYERSHIILLPSESEGFPKVIAEAAAYGCVPVVSDVSSISQYFNESNGFLMKKINPEELAEKIDRALSDRVKLKRLSVECSKTAALFTYEHYIENLKEKILFSKNIK